VVQFSFESEVAKRCKRLILNIVKTFGSIMSENDEGNSVWIAKLIAGLGLFGVSVVCGVIPFKLAKIFKWTEPIDKHDGNSDKKSSKTVAILLSFGGGVLLATTFLHLLPEISHSIDALIEDGLMPDFGASLAETLMMIGFFLIYLIEELVHFYLHKHQQKKAKSDDEKLKDSDNVSDVGGAFIRGMNARNSAIANQFQEAQFDRHNNSIDDLIPSDQHNSNGNCVKNNANHGHGHSHILPLPHTEEEDVLVSSLRGLLIVLALSIHELFEGFAVGLELDAKGVYFMFAAVSAHKFVIAFCIGVELMVQRTKLWLAFVYVLIYSAVSAIGKRLVKKN
jgi:solute carrier family 39 (zinc transporter), member 1/2/3